MWLVDYCEFMAEGLCELADRRNGERGCGGVLKGGRGEGAAVSMEDSRIFAGGGGSSGR